MYKHAMNVTLKKVAAIASGVPQAESVEEYRIDQERGSWGQFFEGKSPPIEYEVQGFIEEFKVDIGSPFTMIRTCRNGVQRLGFFATSNVQAVEETGEGWVLQTKNSVYLVSESE